MTVTMYDSVTVSEIPANAEAVAGYTSGKWPTYNELVAKFPHAHHLSIAVNSGHDADCLDVETGDATPSEAPAWVRRQHARGKKLPVLYANLSTMPSVIAALTANGIHRSEYLLWVAHYDNIANIPSGFDAKQYWDKALGKNLDVSLCSDAFFGIVPTPPKPNTWMPGDEHNWETEWDRIAGKKELRYHLRRLYLRTRMLARRRKITRLATHQHNGWSLENRLYRYKQLQKRS
jgi:hypothetical protein